MSNFDILLSSRALQADLASIGRVLFLFVLPALLTGCSKDYETAPVSGQVTLDGKPLADVGLIFVPLSEGKGDLNIGPGSLGKTDEEGRFTLKTVEGDTGAVPTEHIVRMSWNGSAGDMEGADPLAAPAPSAAKSPLPRSAEDGTLRFTVPPDGTEDANFELQSK